MINKTEVGNRICAMRKNAGLSQASFADKVGVSAQAVSKWETGLALPDIEILLNISWMFKTTINEILEGNNIFRKITNRPFEMDDSIAYFLSKEEHSVGWGKRLIENKSIKNCWEWNKNNIVRFQQITKKSLITAGLYWNWGLAPEAVIWRLYCLRILTRI